MVHQAGWDRIDVLDRLQCTKSSIISNIHSLTLCLFLFVEKMEMYIQQAVSDFTLKGNIDCT